MLPSPVPRKGLQSVSRGYPQVIQACCSIQQRQFAPRLPFEGPKTSDIFVLEETLGVSVGEAPDHMQMLV